MKRVHVVRLSCLAIAVALTGCFESTKPISTAGSVSFDSAVLGTWTCVPDPQQGSQDKATLTIRNLDNHTYDIAWVDSGKTTRYRAHGSKVESTVVINVLEVAPGAKWVFVRYKRDGAKLLLRAANGQEIKGGYEARKMDDLRSRADSDDLFKPFAVCTKAR